MECRVGRRWSVQTGWTRFFIIPCLFVFLNGACWFCFIFDNPTKLFSHLWGILCFCSFMEDQCFASVLSWRTSVLSWRTKLLRDPSDRLFGTFGSRGAKQNSKKKSLDALIKRLRDVS
ncbi:hypothetical protein ES332_D10G173100v1 [Gossypium tomentosum]|uniref:Uncharacterized protein n=1 Tax=Gossypium tomentosum TaxID=34277 RepID=A0A5D2J6S6_GOSTO|nr:hypothetical protein ES332_D10G173100v1 [Gossypium tomentosum]